MESLGSPVLRTQCFHCHGPGSVPGRETKTLKVAQSDQKRNKWMINAADWCVVKIDKTFGGAYKFACLAKHRGLQIINLGNYEL